MANQINRDVYVLSDKVKEHIDYVRFTNALPIVFTFRDYNIPQGSVATAFCTKPSGKAVYTDATISGNAITIDVSDQMFIELGKTVIQVKIENGSSTLVTFGWPVDVHENSTEGDIPPSQNESGFWDELQQQVDEAVENANNAADSVDQAIQETQQAIENANNAASNANEAAQQVFDQQYILTTKHTFGLSDTVEPTSEGSALVESIEGDTWQGENPSPENPQHIYGLGDTGYFDGVWKQGWINGETGIIEESEIVIYSPNKIPCKPGDRIKMIHDTMVVYLVLAIYRKDGSFVQQLLSNTNIYEYEFQIPNGVYFFVPEIQLNAGITPQTAGHTTVLINGKYAVKVETRGKNLFDYRLFPTYSKGGATITNNGDGSFTITGSGNLTQSYDINYQYTKEEALKLISKPGTYKLNDDFNMSILPGFVWGLYNKNGGGVEGKRIYTEYGYSSFEVTSEDIEKLSSGEYVIRTFFYGGDGVPIVTGTVKPCVYIDGNEESIIYQQNKTNLPISSPLYDGDSIVNINGVYKIRRVNGVAVFDGSEDEVWYVLSTKENTISFYTASVDQEGLSGKSNAFQFVSTDEDIEHFRFGGNNNRGTIIFYIKKERLQTQDISGFKTWLQSNPITVVYKLATPVYEDIDQDQFYSIMAADELTNVSLLGENENLVPTNVIRFPRNEDGALVTTAYAIGMTNQIAEESTAPGSVDDRLAALETQMAALNAQTIIVE